ncbi:MAG: START domain-containing protein [Desulfomonilia bacterium]|jgi:hypothetical protein
MRRFVLVVAVGLVFCAQGVFAAPPEGEGWELSKQGEGIDVYTRPVEGLDAKEFMAIGEVDAPLRVIMQVVRDIPSYPQWYGFCRDIRQLEEYNESHRLVYFVLATLWPTKDRDMVIEAVDVTDYEKGISKVTTRALKEEIVPLDKRYVRMTHMIGNITFTEKDGKTHVVYTCQSDPAGKVPVSLSNMIAINQPYDSIVGLRKMVQKDEYWQKAGLTRQ